MFTGIVQEVGQVIGWEGARLALDCGSLFAEEPPVLGESLSVNGCCLTVARIGEGIAFDVSEETASRTTLGRLAPGSRVNLERALQVGDRLGGHLVMGHVDGLGEFVERSGERWTFRVPSGGERYIAHKGSVCIEGVSLTVVEPEGDTFHVAIVPHTEGGTTLRDLKPGDAVNLEYDVLARYVERMLEVQGA